MPEIEIAIDWSWLYNLGQLPFYAIALHFFINGGWLIFIFVFLWGAWKVFNFRQAVKWDAKQTFVMLAVDVPRDNIQSLKAVENIFVALAGAHTPLEWGEKKFEGKFQLGFSFEIVSIDGYIQFLVRTPTAFRNLVEASIYAQYPQAEITEVEDYAAAVDVTFPSDKYNLWGADLVMVNKSYYPLKTYPQFIDEREKEDFFKDPLAAVLEIMSKIGPGEQIWIQLIALPANNDWMHAGRKALEKIMGTGKPPTKNLLDKISDVPLNLLAGFDKYVLGSGDGEPPKKKDDKKFDVNMLTPMMRLEVEAIANKIDKINFDCKMRYIYFGKKEVFKKALAVSGIMGAIKQFSSTHMNALKPGGNKTFARLAFAEFRLAALQNAILKNYKSRNPSTTTGTYILSVEELATLWHFPAMSIKAGMVKKTDAKRTSAPIGLPIDEADFRHVGGVGLPVFEEAKEPQPEEADYDNDYFEDRFAVDKTRAADKQRKKILLAEANRREAEPEASEESRIETVRIQRADFDNHSQFVMPDASQDQPDLSAKPSAKPAMAKDKKPGAPPSNLPFA